MENHEVLTLKISIKFKKFKYENNKFIQWFSNEKSHYTRQSHIRCELVPEQKEEYTRSRCQGYVPSYNRPAEAGLWCIQTNPETVRCIVNGLKCIQQNLASQLITSDVLEEELLGLWREPGCTKIGAELRVKRKILNDK